MKTIISLCIFFIVVLVISSCYYDKEELLYGNPNTPCTDTTTNISYNQYVAPLFRQYCYSCHSGNFPSGNIVMGNYTSDKVLAQTGKLYGSINYSAGYSQMPKGMSKFTSCQIANIKKWIDAGAPNN